MSTIPPKADIRLCCLRAAASGFGQGLLDLAGFPPHDGQTAVIKKRHGGSAMTAHHLVEIGLFIAVMLFDYYWVAREE
jgi:hypothetical protein